MGASAQFLTGLQTCPLSPVFRFALLFAGERYPYSHLPNHRLNLQVAANLSEGLLLARDNQTTYSMRQQQQQRQRRRRRLTRGKLRRNSNRAFRLYTQAVCDSRQTDHASSD